MDEAFGQRVARVGSLADPVRRALYRFVAEQPGAVSLEQRDHLWLVRMTKD